MLRARNDIDEHLSEHDFLRTAPFDTVSLIIRYGESDNLDPDEWTVDARNSELHVSIQLDATKLRALSGDALVEAFRLAMIEVLCDIAANYGLPFEFLDEMRGSK